MAFKGMMADDGMFTKVNIILTVGQKCLSAITQKRVTVKQIIKSVNIHFV